MPHEIEFNGLSMYDITPINGPFTRDMILIKSPRSKVVPPQQAESMYNALLKKGLPTALALFEGCLKHVNNSFKDS